MITNEHEQLQTIYANTRGYDRNRKPSSTNESNSEDVVDYAMTASTLHNHSYAPVKAAEFEKHIKEFGQVRHVSTENKLCRSAGSAGDEQKPTHFYHNQISSLQQQQQQSQQQQQQQSHQSKQYSQNQVRRTSFDKKSPLFQFHRKKSDPTNQQTCNAKDRPKFVKCASIARLFGNTYSTQKQSNQDETKSSGSTHTTLINKTSSKAERFKKCSENQIDGSHGYDGDRTGTLQAKDFCDEKDLGARAFRSLSKSLGRLWRRSHSIEISAPDPEYKVLYLGNVLTGWAKGDSCVEKPLATLWRNYTQNHKPDVMMRVLVCSSGLKATTRQHGLTEYWSNRITHCSAPKNYSRIFCWIYRHEGRKLKHELRCHAVLCPKESVAEQICQTLKDNLSRALREFKRDKMNRQNARLSLVNSVYDNPSMPRRKILLSVGANNYRPPMERSKSAPKLMAIEEAVGEEEDEISHNNAKEESRPSCCRVDPLFPAMTLGRKHCRRGHSIRRTRYGSDAEKIASGVERSRSVCFDDTTCSSECNSKDDTNLHESYTKYSESAVKANRALSNVDDDDDFNSLLMINDYDTQSSLSGELMTYFDTKLKLKSTVSLSELHSLPNEEVSMAADVYGNRIALSLDNLDSVSHGNCDNNRQCSDYDNDEYYRHDNDTFYSQNEIIDCLVNASETQRATSPIEDSNEFKTKHFFDHSLISDDTKDLTNTARLVNAGTKSSNALILDSDEGSISSGCETSSTVTNSNFDEFIKAQQSLESPQCLLSNNVGGNKDDVVSSTTKTVSDIDTMSTLPNDKIKLFASANGNEEDCNSEVSDESGFDEFQNFIGKTGNVGLGLDHHEVREHSINKNMNKHNISNSDSNNNSCNFDTGNKNSSRLMINIPKNAKSILI